MNEKAKRLQAITLELNLKDQLILVCERYKKDYYFAVKKCHELAQAVINLIAYLDQQIEEDYAKSLFVGYIILALNIYLSEVGDNKFNSQITSLIEKYRVLFINLKSHNFLKIYIDLNYNLKSIFSELAIGNKSAQEDLIKIFEKYYEPVCVSMPLVKLFDEYDSSTILSLSELHNLLKANEFTKSTRFDIHRLVNNKQLNMLIDYLIEYPITAPFEIKLSCFNIKSGGAQVLARYLTSGKTPSNLMLRLCNNQIDDEGASHLANAISSGKTSANLGINLNGNPIGEQGIQFLSTAIQSKKAMPGLTILFNEDRNCVFSDLSVKSLAESIQSKYAPNGLKLFLFNLSNAGVEYLATAIRSGNAPLNLSITIGCLDEINEIGMISLIRAVGSGKAPEGISLKLSSVDVNGKLGEELAKLIEEGNAPKRLNLTMITLENKIDLFISLIIKALESGNGPKGLAIDLEFTKINDKTKNNLLDLLVSGKCPAGLQLNATSWLDGDEPFQEAITALLMKETSIIINYDYDARDNICLQRIKFCSLRNKLIFDFPEFENFIKQISIDAQLYNPTNKFINPCSLKISAAFYFLKNKNDISQTLPPEIIEYIKQLDNIHEQLNDNIPNVDPVYGSYASS